MNDDYAERFADNVERTRAERAAGARQPWTRGDRLIAAGVITATVAVVAIVLGFVVGVPALFVNAERTNHAYATGTEVHGTPPGTSAGTAPAGRRCP